MTGRRLRRGRVRWAVASATLALAWALVAPVHAQSPVPVPVPCADAPAAITGADARGHALACDGVNDACRFLAPLGLTQPPRVPEQVVDELPIDLRADAAGCYMSRTRTVHVLTLPRFLGRGKWFNVPTSPALYRALVAHEVAHAIVGCHLGERTLPSAAQEYVAYVSMFATMDADTRAGVLSAMPLDELDHDAEINDMRHAFDPMRFGVEAYRHWLRQRDGMAFLDEVIRGRIAPELSTYN